MGLVSVPQPCRHEHVDRFAEQFVARVPEETVHAVPDRVIFSASAGGNPPVMARTPSREPTICRARAGTAVAPSLRVGGPSFCEETVTDDDIQQHDIEYMNGLSALFRQASGAIGRGAHEPADDEGES